jgi:hypothetical protein
LSKFIIGKSGALALGALFALASQAAAQTILPKPTIGTPTIIAPPSSLSAWSPSRGHVMLTWPAVTGATRYRLTRSDNTGTPEITIVEAPLNWFVFEGATCSAGTSQPTCIFDDASKISTSNKAAIKSMTGGEDIIVVEGTIYPHNVTSGRLYTYRAWAIFPGPVLSPPSPPATVQVK